MTEQGGRSGTVIAVIGAGATIIAALIGLYAALANSGDDVQPSGGGGGVNTPPPPEVASISMEFGDDVVGWHQTYGGQTTVDVWVGGESVGELCTCRGVYTIGHELPEGSHEYRLEATISTAQGSYSVDGYGTIQASDGRPFDVSFGADTSGDGWPDSMELDPLT